MKAHSLFSIHTPFLPFIACTLRAGLALIFIPAFIARTLARVNIHCARVSASVKSSFWDNISIHIFGITSCFFLSRVPWVVLKILLGRVRGIFMVLMSVCVLFTKVNILTVEGTVEF